MAGIIHEVERTDLLEQVRQEAADAARQMAEAARLRRGHIVVVGCSVTAPVAFVKPQSRPCIVRRA